MTALEAQLFSWCSCFTRMMGTKSTFRMRLRMEKKFLETWENIASSSMWPEITPIVKLKLRR